MTKEKFELEVKERVATGKKLREVRDNGFVPATIQKDGKEPKLIMVAQKEMAKIYSGAGLRHPVELTVGKDKQLTVIKEVEKAPLKGTLLHVVFQGIKANQKIIAEVPIELSEVEIPAERAGLIILKTLEQVEVETLPSDMPDSLKLDPSVLEEVGQKLTVADIKAPAGVTILTEAENTVAVVEEPRVQEEPEETTEEAAEDVPAEHGDGAKDNVGEETDKSGN